jgi:hypothetical protein
MILHRTRSADCWKQHLAQPDRHWKPFRSAMETALSWEAQKAVPPEIAALFPNADLLQAIVEYPVALPGGDRDSFNDVFALFADEDGLITCMVEAKRDEPFGPTLAEWCSAPSEGRSRRLGFLCDTLNLNANVLPGTLRYQLLHRTASAVLTARAYRTSRTVMLVQSFSPEHRWFEDYSDFCDQIGLQAKKGALTGTIDLNGVELSLGWVHSPFLS